MKITDSEIKRICSSTIYKRGLEYYKDGRVHLRIRKPDELVAAVDENELFNVHITFDGDRIKDTLCTCPYYHTMGSVCKHIVAVLKTRQAELDKTGIFDNENDRLANLLCSEFSPAEGRSFRIGITFGILPELEGISYTVSLSIALDSEVFAIKSVESFLASYCKKEEYKLTKKISFMPGIDSLDNSSAEIIEILAEAYQNKAVNAGCYSPRFHDTIIGTSTAKRLFPLLNKVDCEYIIDSVTYRRLSVINDNPDILVDVIASDKNINISVTESGLALTADGSYFFFENKIFSTSPEWQEWFMPIYRAIIQRNRTQLEFTGENSIEFAAKVLPKIRHCRGVVCYGIDEMIINEKPTFEIYLDRNGSGISAAVKAFYGNISIMLPARILTHDKIIIRSPEDEQTLLSYFDNFTLRDGQYFLEDEDEIFFFISDTIGKLSEKAKIYTSAAFDELSRQDLPEISAAVNYRERVDLLEITIESELSEKEIADILKAYYSNMAYYRFADGTYFDFSKKSPMLSLLDNLGCASEGLLKGKHRLSKFYALYLAGRAKDGLITANDSFSRMVDGALASKADIPDYLDGVLRDYQKTGVHWLHQLSELGLGGVLADDMGLGKTVQVIAFVMSEKRTKPVLVVAPSSLTYNWLSEINRFAPEARAIIVDGSKENREELLKEINRYDFVITSYALLRRDISDYRDFEFSYCFIDEAQHIKNPGTMNAAAVKQVNAERYFALTGTPIENSLTELWSIFDFALHGYLQTKREFSAKYEKGSAKIPSGLTELRNKIKPFILRRMKKDVLSELPEKIENTIFADFEPEQMQIYSAFLSAARKEAQLIAESGENTIRILSLLTRLRQICCHPRLINEEYSNESGKLILLNELVTSAIEAGHRVLIFSQFTSMLNIISESMRANSIKYFYLDGSTPSSERITMANRFNSGEGDVFLISLKAGGTGLNLVGADTVIHYDPWWNPAVMDQASDRAYRIGQTKAVQVIKLAARNSIEEQILKLAEKKRGLADGVIRENKNLLSALTKDELLELFKE